VRILSITAGAAGAYCGSCLRDNALAAELTAQGHDVVLLPLYTPTLTDETNVSQDRVFFGGISVYLEQHLPLFRKTPSLLDRLWDSSLALRLASRRSIPIEPRLLGELTVSMLKGAGGFQRKEIAKLLRWLSGEPPPDIICLSHALLIGLARPLREALRRPICCTLQGDDLFLEGLGEPYRSQALELIRANHVFVDAFLAVSSYYARFMPHYLGVPAHKVQVVPMGINLAGYPAGPRRSSGVFTIGYFARIGPEKGLHILCQAYRVLRQQQNLPPCRLEAAGYLGQEQKKYLAGIERDMKDWGLDGEFHYRGVPDREGKIGFLASLDVLSVPSTYAEPKGTYLLEAMACGVPVVQPRRGAFPEIIEKTGGGILVESGDSASLAKGILALLRNPSRAAELGRNGARGVREHYSVARMAASAVEAFENICAPSASQPLRPTLAERV